MKKLWDPAWGDRRQELAVIGVGLDEQRVREELDACLLTDREMRLGPAGWQGLPDPFPRWRMGGAED